MEPLKSSSTLQRGMSKRYDVLLRLLLIGETGVGKTCLLCRYANDEFVNSHITTIGIDFKMKTLDINGKTVKVQIWDTAGQERFESITKQFYRRAQGILLVYDITSRVSFEALPKWLSYIHQFAKDDVSLMLLGNKCDRDYKRQVSYNEAKKFAAENSMLFYETSAKLCDNLEKAFYGLCQNVMDNENYSRNKKAESDYNNDQNNHGNQSECVNDKDTVHLIGNKEDQQMAKKWGCCSLL